MLRSNSYLPCIPLFSLPVPFPHSLSRQAMSTPSQWPPFGLVRPFPLIPSLSTPLFPSQPNTTPSPYLCIIHRFIGLPAFSLSATARLSTASASFAASLSSGSSLILSLRSPRPRPSPHRPPWPHTFSFVLKVLASLALSLSRPSRHARSPPRLTPHFVTFGGPQPGIAAAVLVTDAAASLPLLCPATCCPCRLHPPPSAPSSPFSPGPCSRTHLRPRSLAWFAGRIWLPGHAAGTAATVVFVLCATVLFSLFLCFSLVHELVSSPSTSSAACSRLYLSPLLVSCNVVGETIPPLRKGGWDHIPHPVFRDRPYGPL